MMATCAIPWRPNDALDVDSSQLLTKKRPFQAALEFLGLCQAWPPSVEGAAKAWTWSPVAA